MLSRADKDEILELIKNSFSSLLTSKTYLATIEENINSSVVKAITPLLDKYEEKVAKLEDELTKAKSDIILLQKKADEQEQYSRRSNIRIFGIEEDKEENTDDIIINLVNKQLKVDMNVNSIDRSHRTGQRKLEVNTSKKPRPIIVKFTSYRERQKVLQNRKMLKGSGIVIREDLTRTRLTLWQDAVKTFGYQSVWTRDGVIFVVKNGNKYALKSNADLKSIM